MDSTPVLSKRKNAEPSTINSEDSNNACSDKSSACQNNTKRRRRQMEKRSWTWKYFTHHFQTAEIES